MPPSGQCPRDRNGCGCAALPPHPSSRDVVSVLPSCPCRWMTAARQGSNEGVKHEAKEAHAVTLGCTSREPRARGAPAEAREASVDRCVRKMTSRMEREGGSPKPINRHRSVGELYRGGRDGEKPVRWRGRGAKATLRSRVVSDTSPPADKVGRGISSSCQRTLNMRARDQGCLGRGNLPAAWNRRGSGPKCSVGGGGDRGHDKLLCQSPDRQKKPLNRR